MSIPTTGWSNKSGTADRACVCGTWKQHWINISKKSWPSSCSINSCYAAPTLGGHVINPDVGGERIAPLCDSCNKLAGIFTLKVNVSVPSANKSQTCEK
jgi:hypothetical protein